MTHSTMEELMEEAREVEERDRDMRTTLDTEALYTGMIGMIVMRRLCRMQVTRVVKIIILLHHQECNMLLKIIIIPRVSSHPFAPVFTWSLTIFLLVEYSNQQEQYGYSDSPSRQPSSRYDHQDRYEPQDNGNRYDNGRGQPQQQQYYPPPPHNPNRY
jgi:hypothetical protein